MTTAAPAAPTCAIVRPDSSYEGKQGGVHFAGIAAETVGARGLCLHVATIPPGVRGKAHLHHEHESAMYVLGGEAEMWYGEGLREHLIVRAGEFLYIPAGMPHLPANTSADEPCTVVLARTDPNEQESVVLLPELDTLVPPAAGG